ncbi:MAG TPA: hypothetical protein DDZ51_23270 [Planctomycetaceae bacterium]|nr:hypothetical protein [Planctomycetaceae bacterium]
MPVAIFGFCFVNQTAGLWPFVGSFVTQGGGAARPWAMVFDHVAVTLRFSIRVPVVSLRSTDRLPSAIPSGFCDVLNDWGQSFDSGCSGGKPTGYRR